MKSRFSTAAGTFVLYFATSLTCFALDPLTGRLLSPNWNSALTEIRILDENSKNRIARELADAIKTGDLDVRLRAQMSISQFGKAGVGPLRALLREQRGLIRSSAIQALGGIGAEASEAAAELIPVMEADGDEQARRDAAIALGKINPAPAVAQPAFLRAMSDRDDHVRRWAVEGLGNLQPPSISTIPILERIARSDVNGDVRIAAIGVISKLAIKAPSTVSTMRGALTDSNGLVRAAAVRAIGKAGPTASVAVSDLAALIQRDTDEYVRTESARALGDIGGPARPAVPAILTLLTSRENHTRSTAASALAAIVPDDSISANALIAALNDSDMYVRHSVIRTLGAMGAPAQAAIPALAARVGTRDADERLLSITALGQLAQFNPAQTIPVFLRVIEEGSVGSRSEALRALMQFTPIPESAIPVLMRQLELDDPMGANLELAVALGRIGQPAVPSLLNALKSQKEQVRYYATRAFKRMDPPARAATGALTAALADPSERVRSAAAEALAALR